MLCVKFFYYEMADVRYVSVSISIQRIPNIPEISRTEATETTVIGIHRTLDSVGNLENANLQDTMAPKLLDITTGDLSTALININHIRTTLK